MARSRSRPRLPPVRLTPVRLPPVRVSPVGATLAGALALLLLILAASVAIIRHTHQRELHEAERELLSFDTVLARQTSQVFQSIELVQRTLVDELMDSGLAQPGDLRRLGTGPAMHERLRELISGVPQMDALSLVDRDGGVVNFSRDLPLPTRRVSDRPIFRRLSAPDAPETAISRATNASTGAMTVYLARRLSGARGEFLGLVVAAVRVAYFEDFYRRLDLPAGSAIALWREDGTLLSRYPPNDEAGAPDDEPPMSWRFANLAPGRDRAELPPPGPEGRRQLVVGRRLVEQPVVVGFARDLRDVLAQWRLDSAVVAVCAFACAAAVLGLAVLVVRQFRAYESAAALLSSQRAAERSLRQAEARLLDGQRLEAVGRIAAGIGHDFNNLLTVVRANAELLAAVVPDEKGARRIAAICHAADRGATLTRQMLAFARQQRLDPQLLDPAEVARDMAQLLRSSVGARIALDLPRGGSWPVFADAGQLRQAVVNLVLNARDALPDGGTIAIDADDRPLAAPPPGLSLPPGDYVRIRVSDDGAGMPPEVLRRAFDPFFTTREQGKGTGLGLSQAQGFARQSGGDVMLESSPGKGTAASILLPRAIAPGVAPDIAPGIAPEVASCTPPPPTLDRVPGMGG